MEHIYRPGSKARAIVLFHGTGGSAEDLMGIARAFDKSAHVFGLQGDVVEHGMKRFFKRIRPGVFDEEDLVKRTHALDRTLSEIAEQYEIPVSKMVLVGYSNGANLIASYLSLYGEQASGVFLFQPMRPFKDLTFNTLQGYPVFISAGTNDPIVPVDESKALIDPLLRAGAYVQVHWHDDGHSLSQKTLEEARTFFRTHWA
jgi:phospholipase/carboxylesterase